VIRHLHCPFWFPVVATGTWSTINKFIRRDGSSSLFVMMLMRMVYERKNEPGNEPTKGYLSLSSRLDGTAPMHVVGFLLDSIRWPLAPMHVICRFLDSIRLLVFVCVFVFVYALQISSLC
jgi:hypothetical protein